MNEDTERRIGRGIERYCRPVVLAKIESTPESHVPPGRDDLVVFQESMACVDFSSTADEIAAEFRAWADERLATMTPAEREAMTVLRIGLDSIDYREMCERLTELGYSVTVLSSGDVTAREIVDRIDMLEKPRGIAARPDYLRHDPTKSHRRRKERSANGRARVKHHD